MPSAREQREWELRAVRFNGGSIAPATTAAGAATHGGGGAGKKRKAPPSSKEKDSAVTGQKQLLAFFARKD